MNKVRIEKAIELFQGGIDNVSYVAEKTATGAPAISANNSNGPPDCLPAISYVPWARRIRESKGFESLTSLTNHV